MVTAAFNLWRRSARYALVLVLIAVLLMKAINEHFGETSPHRLSRAFTGIVSPCRKHTPAFLEAPGRHYAPLSTFTIYFRRA